MATNPPSGKIASRLILVVLYKESLTSSPTILSLREAKPNLRPADKILIWDNSPQRQPDRSLKALASGVPAGIAYRHTPENTPLSVLYNLVVEEHPGFEFVLFFDQDSSFAGTYFSELDSASAAYPDIALFAPLVRAGGRVVSPGHFWYFKGKHWNSPRTGIIPTKNTVAIMSGLAVRSKYLAGQFGKFDERLRLYGIDTNFLLRYGRHNRHLYVLSAPFGHDLSDFKKESAEIKRRRFADFKQASLINAELFGFPVRSLTRIFLWYKSLRTALRQ